MTCKSSVTVAVALLLACVAAAQEANMKYPSMAPLEQYLIADRDAEISLARSAAPPSISEKAEVLVLTRHGYETAVQGTNGFVCVVGRGWFAGPLSLRRRPGRRRLEPSSLR